MGAAKWTEGMTDAVMELEIIWLVVATLLRLKYETLSTFTASRILTA